MTATLTWLAAPLKIDDGGEVVPSFDEDYRFTHEWWHQTLDFLPPTYEWRSYFVGEDEVARAHLNVDYFGDLNAELDTPGVLIWELEVRNDRRGEGIGTGVVEQLDAEFADRNLYAGPTYDRAAWWARFGWDSCDCAHVETHPMLVRRAGDSRASDTSDPVAKAEDRERDIFAPAGGEEVEPDDLTVRRWRHAAKGDDGPDLMDPNGLY